jgi:hypothetical protein
VEDTVEKDVQGLAEQIIKEDEAKRKEELVSWILFSTSTYVESRRRGVRASGWRVEGKFGGGRVEVLSIRTCSIYNPEGRIGI